MADQTRTFRVVLEAVATNFTKGLNSATASVQQLGKSVAGIGGIGQKLGDSFKALTSGGGISGALAAIGPAGLAASAGLGAVALGLRVAGKELAALAGQAEAWTNQAESTGLGVVTVQQLRATLEDAGIPAETLTGAMRKLHAEIADGGKNLKQFGIDLAAIRDLSPEQQLQAVAQAIGNITDVNDRAAAAQAAFGRSGEQLIPVLDDIAESAFKVQGALGEEQVKSLQHLDSELDKAARSWTNFKNGALAGVASVINALDDFEARTNARGGVFSNSVTESLADFNARLSRIAADTSELSLGPAGPEQKAALAAYQEQQRSIQNEIEKTAEEAKKAAEAHAALVAELSGTKATEEVQRLAAAFDEVGVNGVADLEALRAKLEQLGKQGAKITSKGLLGVLAGGKIEIPKELGDLDLGASLGELDPAILAQSQQTFTSIALSAAAAGLSTKEIEDALQGAGASGGQLEVALAAIPVSFGSVFKDTLSQLPNVILSAIQGGGDVGKSVGSFFGGSFLGGLTGEKGPLSVGNLSKVFGDTFGGAINAILPGLGSLLGAGLGSLLGKLFGDKTIMKLNDVRDAFFETHGGYQQLGADLTAILNSGDKASALIKELFDAKTPEQFDAAVAKVKEILSSLNDSVEPVTIPVNIEVTGGDAAGVALPALEEAIPSFAEGTRGFQNFGAGTLAMLHGIEAVVPEGSSPDLGGGDVYNISVPINENPLQTFEGLQRQREFTIKTVRRDLTRSLSQAVSAGVA